MARPRLPRELEYRFWEVIRAGGLMEAAAETVGVSWITARRWFHDGGGVMPPVSRRSGTRLSFTEREEMACLRAGGLGVREIARQLGRDPSTISRELRRTPAPTRGRRVYRASVAQADADHKARRPKPAKLAINLRLRHEVQARLCQNHSPEQISARLVQDFGDDEEMRVSPETIYRSIYVQGRGGLRRELARHLRTGRVGPVKLLV